MLFFACAKKNQKSTPENDVHLVFGEEVLLSFRATMASAFGILLCSLYQYILSK